MTHIQKKLWNRSGEGSIDTGVKIIIGIVIGALILGGLYALFATVILPKMNDEVDNMMDYGKNGVTVQRILDDQTGTVCSITLTKSDETLETTVNTAQLKNQMRALCSLYLEELGTAFSRFDADSIASNAYFQGENTLISTLSWSDIMYGEVRINFLISPDQFSVRVV